MPSAGSSISTQALNPSHGKAASASTCGGVGGDALLAHLADSVAELLLGLGEGEAVDCPCPPVSRIRGPAFPGPLLTPEDTPVRGGRAAAG